MAVVLVVGALEVERVIVARVVDLRAILVRVLVGVHHAAQAVEGLRVNNVNLQHGLTIGHDLQQCHQIPLKIP